MQILKLNDISIRKAKSLKLMQNCFDFQTFAHWTMNDHWDKLSSKQKEDFLTIFRKSFTEKILKKLASHSKNNFSVEIVGVHSKNDIAEVKCLLKKNGKQGFFTVIWIRRSDSWSIVDIEVSKASLVANYQGQFNKIIRDYGFEEVLKRMENETVQ